MIFTKEQWFEVWKRHMGPFASASDDCIASRRQNLNPDRPLGTPEYDGIQIVKGYPKPLNNVLLAIAEKDAAEVGVHPEWIERWARDEANHASIVWTILWLEADTDHGQRWKNPVSK